MSRYDSYVQKMQKIYKVKYTCYRFRFLIGAMVALIVALTSSFLITQGQILKDAIFPTNLAYGENVEFSKAEVLFGDPSYEFRLEGSETWSEEKPTRPGTYYARVKSNRSFGTKGYGKTTKFTIAPKQATIDITSSSIEYGTNPNYTLDLCYEDKVENIDFIYENRTLNNTKVKVDLNTLKITNSEGNDVTSFYDFESEFEDIAFTKRHVVLQPAIESKVYDGLSVSKPSELTSTKIGAYDDEVTFDTEFFDAFGTKLTEMPTKAGSYTCKIDPMSVKFKTQDQVTNDNYAISLQSQSFKIYPRDIKVVTGSLDTVYDGLVHSNNRIKDCSISPLSNYQLVDGHQFVLKENSITEVTNAGVYQNILDLDVVDKDGNILTDNYNLNYEYGLLNIDKLKVEVTPNSIENKAYDGVLISYVDGVNNFEKTSVNLPEGQELQIEVAFNSYNNLIVKDANEYQYLLNDYQIIGGNKDNYEIVLLGDKKFTISPRELSIKPELFDSKVYDGNYYSFSDLANNFSYVDGTTIDHQLVEGEAISAKGYFVKDNVNYEAIKNAGLYQVKLDLSRIIGLDQTKVSNYKFNFVPYDIEISKRDLTITPKTTTEILGPTLYDNSERNFLVNFENSVIDESTSLASTDLLRINQVSYKRDDISSLCKNAGTYQVNIEDYQIFINGNENNEDVTSNYNVTLLPDEYTIDKIKITIAPSVNFVSDTNIYDGKVRTYDYQNNDNFDLLIGSFAPNEYLKVTEVKFFDGIEELEAKNVFNYEMKITKNAFEFSSSDLRSHEEILANYEVSLDYNAYAIEPRTVSINPNSLLMSGESNIYDGKVRTYNYEIRDNYKYLPASLEMVEGEHFHIDAISFIKESTSLEVTPFNFGTYTLNISNYTISYDDGRESANSDSNYNFVLGTDTYTIEKRTIKIKPNTDALTDCDILIYNGVIREYLDSSYLYDTDQRINMLADGDILYIDSVKFYSSKESTTPIDIKNVGTYYLRVDELGYHFTSSNGYATEEELMENYIVIISEDVTFTISPRPVSISPITPKNKDYDGVYFDYANDYNYINNFVYNKDSLEFIERVGIDVKYLFEDNYFDKVKDAHTYSIVLNEYLDRPYHSSDETFLVSNYEISFEAVSFSIDKAKVTISTVELGNRGYDGLEVVYPFGKSNFVVVEGTIVEGEEYQIDVYYTVHEQDIKLLETPKNVGTYDVYIEKIYEGNDISNIENYEFTFLHTSFSIDQAKIVIRAREELISDTNVYNGKARTYDTTSYEPCYFIEGSLAANQYISALEVNFYLPDNPNKVDAIDVNTYLVRVDSLAIYEGESLVDLSKNYDIIIKDLTYEIVKREVIIKAHQSFVDDLIYNGLTKNYDYTINNNFEYVSANRFVNEDYLTITGVRFLQNGLEVSPVDAGNYQIEILSYKMGNLNVNKEEIQILNNYTIILELGGLVITPRIINITTKDMDSFTYDGNLHQYFEGENNFEYVDPSDTEHLLVGQDSLTISVVFNMVEYEGKDINLSEVRNAGHYYLVITDHQMVTGKISNYQVNYINKETTLEIKSKVVSTNPIDLGKVTYTGKEVLYPSYFGNYNPSVELCGGDELMIIVQFTDSLEREVEAVEPGIYNIKIISWITNDGYHANYKVEQLSEVGFEIVRKELHISPDDLILDKEYDGLKVTYPSHFGNYHLDKIVDQEGSSTIPSFKIDVYFKNVETDKIYKNGSVLDAGTYKIFILENSIVFENEEEKDRYEIIDTKREVIFEVTPREVGINLLDAQAIYDGEVFQYLGTNYQVEPGRILEGEEFTITVTYDKTPINVGTYQISLGEVFFLREGKASNYHFFEASKGQLTIDPRVVYLGIDLGFYGNKQYDRNYAEASEDFGNYYVPSGTTGDHQVISTDRIKLFIHIKDLVTNLEYDKVKNAGSYSAYCYDYEVENGHNENYEVHVSPFNFEIERREVRIEPNGAYVTGAHFYDGEDHFYDLNKEKPYTIVDGEYYKINNVDIYYDNALVDCINHAGHYSIQLKEEYISFFSVDPSETKEDLVKNYIVKIYIDDYNHARRTININPLEIPSFDYKGELYVYPSYEGNFVKGEGLDFVSNQMIIVEVSYTKDGLRADPYDAGQYIVNISNIIPNANLDLTNYEFIKYYGKFEIFKRDITISLKDIEPVIYNGQIQYPYVEEANNFNLIEGTIPEADELSISVYYHKDPLDVGVYAYFLEQDKVKSHGVITNNFNVICSSNSFEIKPYSLKISPIYYEEFFNGLVHNYDKVNQEELNYQYLDENRLFNNDHFSIDVIYLYNGAVVDPINAYTYETQIDSITFSEGKATNYVIDYSTKGTFKILPVTLTMYYETSEKMYNGEFFSPSDLGLKQDGICYPSIITPTRVTFINQSTLEETSKVKNAGTYILKIDESSLVFNNEVDRLNYIIKIEESIFTITPIDTVSVLPYLFDSITYGEGAYDYLVDFNNYRQVKLPQVLSEVEFKIEFHFIGRNEKGSEDFGTHCEKARAYTLEIFDFEVKNDLRENYAMINIDSSYRNPAFTIYPREIIVNTGSATFEYDGYAHSFTEGFSIDQSSMNNLLEGHKLVLGAHSKIFEVSDVRRGKDNRVLPYSNAIQADVCMDNEMGVREYFTDNYSITYINGKLTINPRLIKTTSNTSTMTYTGQSLIDNAFTYEGQLVDIIGETGVTPERYSYIVEGPDKLIATASYRYIDAQVDPYINDLDYKITRLVNMNSSSGYHKVVLDVTHNYDIEETHGTITINKKNITISFESGNKRFDNKEFVYGVNMISSSSAIDKNALLFDVILQKNTLNVDEIMAGGHYDITISNLKFKETVYENGVMIERVVSLEEAKNYNFTVSNYHATYDIEKVDLSVVMRGKSFVYDGKPHYYDEIYYKLPFEDQYLFEYFTISIDESRRDEILTVTNPGDKKKNVLPYVFNYPMEYIKDSFNIIENIYDISIANKIEFDFKSYTYRGYTLFEPGTIKIDLARDVDSNEDIKNMTLKVTGFKLTLTNELFDNKEVNEVRDVGTYTVEPIPGQYKVYVYYENESGEQIDLTDKYEEPQCSYYSFTIFKGKIYVKAKSASKDYDGLPLNSNEPVLFNLRLDNHHYDDSTLNPELEDVNIVTSSETDAGIHRILVNEVFVFNKEEGIDVSYRYDIYTSLTYEGSNSEKVQFYSKYTINRKQINVKTYGGVKEYDGESLINNRYDYDPSELLAGHTLKLSDRQRDNIRVGRYINRLRFEVYDQNGKEVTRNYNFIYASDKEEYYINIHPRELIVSSASQTFTYDPNNPSQIFTCHQVTSEGLIPGDMIVEKDLVFVGEISYIGEAKNEFAENTIKIKNKRGQTITNCYRIIAEYGTLTVI